ncbi:MAG: glycosyltransferase family 39 protein [Magnetococcales bacterium]|nr:glycosyltransferase family 39 protein [Magnetococcales bacterium]
MNSKPAWWFLVPGYGLLAGLYGWVASRPLTDIQTFLQDHSPRLLYAHLALILVATLLNGQSLLRFARHLPPTVRRGLLLLAVAGSLMAAWVAPATHRIFYDEDIYQGIAMNMVWSNQAQMCNEGYQEYGVFYCQRGEYNKQPNGFPFLLSTVYQLVGVHEHAAFLLNNLLLGVATVTVFAIAIHVFHSLWAGLFAALITVMIPQNLHWFNTTAAEPAAAVSAALAVLAGLHAAQKKSNVALLLFTSIAAFSLHMRPENSLILVVSFVLILLQWPRFFLQSRCYLFLGVFAFLILPVFMHALLVHENPWGSSTTPFAPAYFWHNFSVNFKYYFNNVQFPTLFTLLALAGVLQRRSWRGQMLLWIWFLLLWGIFLFFYAGRYDYGADIRFAIPSHLPLALLAGGATQAIGHRLATMTRRPARQWYTIMTLLLLLAFLPFLPKVRATTSEAWAARADHYHAHEMAKIIPNDAMILTHNPSMFHLWGNNAAQASIALEEPNQAMHYYFQRFRGGVYFHYNFWCNVADPLQNSFCTHLLERYRHELVVDYRVSHFHYALYRLLPPSGS